MLKPGLTSFVLFKDGEDILRRHLASVRPFVEEIVAVDTGAKDRCREIALEHGARVFDLDWPGGFDAAYNFCIDQVETDWTLYLDSDEWLAEGAGPMLREAMANEDAFAYRLIRQDITDEQGRYTEMEMLRLWRTTPGLRMLGLIHARFKDDDLERAMAGRSILGSDIRFKHDGFKAADDTEEKVRRNIELIEKELELRPGQIYYETCLCLELMNIGEKRGQLMATRLMDDAIAADTATPPCLDMSFIISHSLTKVHDLDLTSPRTEAIIRLAWKWFGGVPYVVWSLALVEERRRRIDKSFAALLRLEQMAETGQYARVASFNPAILGEPMLLKLAVMAKFVKRPEVARRAYEKLLAMHPGHPIASQQLAR